jgi:hypothetical protein
MLRERNDLGDVQKSKGKGCRRNLELNDREESEVWRNQTRGEERCGSYSRLGASIVKAALA